MDTDEPNAAFGRNHNFLDCGGKRSATPLLEATGGAESGVAAALQSSLRFASAGCHRTPNLCRPCAKLQVCITDAGGARHSVCSVAGVRLGGGQGTDKSRAGCPPCRFFNPCPSVFICG